MKKSLLRFFTVRIILAVLVFIVIQIIYFTIISGIVWLFGANFGKFMLNNDWAVIVWICIIAFPSALYSISLIGNIWLDLCKGQNKES